MSIMFKSERAEIVIESIGLDLDLDLNFPKADYATLTWPYISFLIYIGPGDRKC